MYIDTQDILIFAHALLFGYWLGADLGVFFCDSQLMRHDLDLEERLRVRQIRKKVDLAPRTCLVLILAVGFTLSVRYASPVTGVWLALTWIACLAWLWLIWMVRFTEGTPRGRKLERFDFGVWYGISAVMILVGAYSLVVGGPIVARWLAVKMLLYGVIVLNGTWILRVGSRWENIFAMVRAGGEERERGEALIKTNRRDAAKAALSLWFLVAVTAFVGATKPF